MKRSYWIVIILVALLAIGYWLWQRSRETQVAIDFVEQFVTAEKSSSGPLEAVFSVGDQNIAGESRPGIYMHPTSRLIYRRVTVPDDAVLRTWMAIKQEAWDKRTDGVLFRVLVSDGRESPEVINQHVDPSHNPGDRRWVPAEVDLSAYAGEQVDIIFYTNSSLPGQGDNNAHDFAVWGDPAIVVRR
jgi:hypothetical protein